MRAQDIATAGLVVTTLLVLLWLALPPTAPAPAPTSSIPMDNPAVQRAVLGSLEECVQYLDECRAHRADFHPVRELADLDRLCGDAPSRIWVQCLEDKP